MNARLRKVAGRHLPLLTPILGQAARTIENKGANATSVAEVLTRPARIELQANPPGAPAASNQELEHLSVRAREILSKRQGILVEFERSARSGFIRADALIGKLHTNHLDALAEDRRTLDALEQELETLLRRLDSRFPAPPPPEPPTPERARHYGPLRDIWRPGNTRANGTAVPLS